MLRTTSITRILIVVLFVQLVLSFFAMDFVLNRLFGLTPSLVVPDGQIWRLFTYPLGVDRMAVFIALVTLMSGGEEVEQIMGRRQYGTLLVLLGLIAGLVHLFVFFGQPYPELVGMMNLGLFVLVGYFYLFPHGHVRIPVFIFFSFQVRTVFVLSLVCVALAAWTGMLVSNGASPLVVVSYGGFGLVMGAMFFHVRYQKYKFLLGPIRRLEALFSGVGRGALHRPAGDVQRKARSVVMPVIQNPGTGRAFSRMTRPAASAQAPSQSPISDEDRLNAILDRISANGYESLGEDDKKFLKDYSNKL